MREEREKEKDRRRDITRNLGNVHYAIPPDGNQGLEWKGSKARSFSFEIY